MGIKKALKQFFEPVKGAPNGDLFAHPEGTSHNNPSMYPVGFSSGRQWDPIGYGFEPRYPRQNADTQNEVMASDYELYVCGQWELREKKPNYW